MKLALGTVQFGLNYGAFNTTGQVDMASVADILNLAHDSGVDTLDTARAYGESEAVLGQFYAANRFSIVTKIASLSGSPDPSADVRASLLASLAALGADRLQTVMFHNAEDLLDSHADAAWQAAEEFRIDGKIGSLGVSVYSSDQAEAIAARFPIATVQLPVNVFDQRAITCGALTRLKQAGVAIHARSAFLQGFALSDPDLLPKGLEPFRSALVTFQAGAKEAGLSPVAAALGFVLQHPDIDRVVVGVQSAAELSDLIGIARADAIIPDFSACASENPALINPGQWPRNA